MGSHNNTNTLFLYFSLNLLNPDNIGRLVALHPEQVQESKHLLFCAELFATNMAGKSLFQLALIFFHFFQLILKRRISMKSLLFCRGNITQQPIVFSGSSYPILFQKHLGETPAAMWYSANPTTIHKALP